MRAGYWGLLPNGAWFCYSWWSVVCGGYCRRRQPRAKQTKILLLSSRSTAWEPRKPAKADARSVARNGVCGPKFGTAKANLYLPAGANSAKHAFSVRRSGERPPSSEWCYAHVARVMQCVTLSADLRGFRRSIGDWGRLPGAAQSPPAIVCASIPRFSAGGGIFKLDLSCTAVRRFVCPD